MGHRQFSERSMQGRSKLTATVENDQGTPVFVRNDDRVKSAWFSELVVNADKGVDSFAGDEVAGMGEIDVEAIKQIVDVDLKVEMLGDGVLENGVEDPVAGNLF